MTSQSCRIIHYLNRVSLRPVVPVVVEAVVEVECVVVDPAVAAVVVSTTVQEQGE